ncbi:MAG: 50S ribosomal protein L18 [Planctomycetota bacterium]|nr:MAG: 50S ribosomal protein L18 [Planctomycetota bacterium]
MRLEKRLSVQRQRRKFRVRNALRNSGRPRLSIYGSGKHIYAQIIDDVAGNTMVSASTLEKSLGGAGTCHGNCEGAVTVGKAIAERALAKGVVQVCFDRGGRRYHGRVAALAEAARQAGLDF